MDVLLIHDTFLRKSTVNELSSDSPTIAREHYQDRDREPDTKEGLSRTPSHDCLTALIFSHEIDGVRKEKERLTAVSLLFLWRLTNSALIFLVL